MCIKCELYLISISKRILQCNSFTWLHELYLSSPIACVACKRTELLKTEIHEEFLFHLNIRGMQYINEHPKMTSWKNFTCPMLFNNGHPNFKTCFDLPKYPIHHCRAAHSLIWLKNVQKVCPFAYAPFERHLTLLLTCRLFPRVP